MNGEAIVMTPSSLGTAIFHRGNRRQRQVRQRPILELVP